MSPANPFALDPDAIADPDAFYAAMRDRPVEYVEEIDAGVITRYDDIRAVVRHDGVRTSNRVAIGPRWARRMGAAIETVLADPASPRAAVSAAKRSRWSLLNTADPPDHDRHRRLVARAFSPRAVGAMESRIAVVADRLLDVFDDGGVHDAVAEFSEPFPAEVMAHMLGVPVDGIERFLGWTADITHLFGKHDLSQDEFAHGLTSQGEMMDYLAGLVELAQRDDHDTLIGTLARPGDDGDRLSDDEILGVLVILLVAGTETTTNLVTGALAHLASSPGLADRLRGDGGLIPPIVEEVLRLESPAQGIFRRVLADLELGEVTVPAGDHLFLAFGAANLDGDVFDDPRRMSTGREAPPHVAFGHGLHFCLGAPLARREAKLAIDRILARFCAIELADGFELRYRPSYFLRGIAELPLRAVATASVPDT